MDGAHLNHYVPPQRAHGERRLTDSRVQLLLFLSAMLASLTGFMSGDRAVEPRHVEQALSAASAIVDVAPVAVRKAEIAAPVTAPIATPASLGTFYPAAVAALAGRARVDERRLE